MNYKTILIFVMLLMAVVSSYASTPDLDYVYMTDQPGEISRPCFDTGGWSGWCSNETLCQISVFNDINHPIILGANMTNQISTHNFTLPVFNDSGIYKVDMACMTPNNLTGYDTFFFGVNNAGSNYNDNSSVMFILGILIGLIILFALCAYFLNDWLRMSFLLLTILMLPVTLWVSMDIARNSFMGEAVVNVIATGYYVSLTGFVAMLLYFLIVLLSQLKIRNNTIKPSDTGSPLYWRKKQDYAKKHPDRHFK